MSTLLLHNPIAGASHPDAQVLMNALKAAGHSPTYQSIKEEFEPLLHKDWELIVVAGGDGTLERVARRMRDRKTPIAILPVGTANNIAQAVGLGETDVEQLAASLKQAKLKRLDVGLAKGPWGKRRFLEAVGFGILATAIAESGPRPPLPIRVDLGREQLKDYLKEARAERFEIDIDGEKYAGEFLLVEIMNLGRTGPSLPLTLNAEHDDGLLDVVFLFKNDRTKMLSWLDDPTEGTAPVTIKKGRRVKLKWKHGHARVDDRVYLTPDEAHLVDVSIEESGLNVLVPYSAAARLSPAREAANL